MNDHSPKRLPSVLLILALAGLGASVIADEPPAESQKTAGEQSAESTKNALRWRTATEVDNFGYNIYRAEAEDGPFERLNSDPIPGAGTSDEPTSYEFIDDTIEPDTTYWYYLESISMSGVKERFTSTFRKEPKSKQAPADPESGSEDGNGDPDQQ